uniref:Uncharacterized protein n=1 Tax=Caenorhabditis japonica TaxID=281687 RepID=A0A8R1IFX6_CAEJA
MGTIFNHVFGSTKLNRPQEELNQEVQIAVCNSLATTPSDTDCKRYELIIKCLRESGVQLVFTFNNFFLLLLRRKSYKYLLSAHQNDQTRPVEEFMRRKRQSETPEESATRKKKDRESSRLRRADSTEKEKMMERISNSQSKLEKRLSETQERAEEEKASLQSNSKAKRASETKEQRTERFTYHSTRYRNKKDEKNATTAKDAFGGGR